jgi:hypothetical protein
MLRCLSYPVVSRSLAVLLLAAAVLKLRGLAVDPVARIGIFSDPWFQSLIVEFELFLGFWLLSGWWRIEAWAMVCLTFIFFAGFSFYSGWIGGNRSPNWQTSPLPCRVASMARR